MNKIDFMRHATLLFIAAPLILISACTPGNSYTSGASNSVSSPENKALSAPAAAESTAISIAIQGFQFSPTDITVKKGTTVLWNNRDSASHTVTGENGGPDSPSLSTGQAYSFTFSTPGTFSYHCTFHPSMKGTVTVTP